MYVCILFWIHLIKITPHTLVFHLPCTRALQSMGHYCTAESILHQAGCCHSTKLESGLSERGPSCKIESSCTSICVVGCKATSLLATMLCLTNFFGIQGCGAFPSPSSLQCHVYFEPSRLQTAALQLHTNSGCFASMIYTFLATKTSKTLKKNLWTSMHSKLMSSCRKLGSSVQFVSTNL